MAAARIRKSGEPGRDLRWCCCSSLIAAEAVMDATGVGCSVVAFDVPGMEPPPRDNTFRSQDTMGVVKEHECLVHGWSLP